MLTLVLAMALASGAPATSDPRGEAIEEMEAVVVSRTVAGYACVIRFSVESRPGRVYRDTQNLGNKHSRRWCKSVHEGDSIRVIGAKTIGFPEIDWEWIVHPRF